MIGARSARLLVALLVVAVAAVASGVTYAALVGATTNPGNSLRVGSVALTDNDAGSAMLGMASAPGGTTDTSCMNVTSTGTLPATVREYGDPSGALAPYLTLTVTRGSGASTFDSCAGFTADTVNYAGAGPGVLYRGPLSGYPSSWASGLVDPGDQDRAGSTYASTVLADPGLVSYWRLGDPKLLDSFAGTAGTLLTSHTADSAATWTKHASLADNLVLTDANRLRESGSGGGLAYASAAPATADYQVEADLYVTSRVAGDAAGVVGRLDTANANGTYYLARYRDSQWQLVKRVNGVETTLGTSDERLLAGASYRLRLDLQGSTIRVLVDGTQRISATDASIVAAGRAGVRIGDAGSTATQSNAAGLHVDNVRLIDSAPLSTARDSKGSNHQAYNNGPTPTRGALGGDGDRAASFDGVDDYVRVTRQIQNDLSIEFWFASTQGLNANDANGWWDNAGLVDADISGAISDFGVSLRSDGRVAAGIGDWFYGDKTIRSAPGYNDGAWHHVVFTRSQSTRALRLYVDGALAASLDTSIYANLDSSADIDFGRIHSGGKYFKGALDEIAVYSRVLSAADVKAHFDAVRSAPETWITGETHSYRFDVALSTDPNSTSKSATATMTWEGRGP